MADIYGTNYTKKYITGGYDRLITSKYSSGKKRVILDEYDGALGNGDVLRMGRLPRGAVVVGGNISHEALGANVTLKCGNYSPTNTDDNDDDRYLTATAAATAGDLPLVQNDVIGLNPYINDSEADDCQIVITVGGAAGIGAIKVTIEYVVE